MKKIITLVFISTLLLSSCSVPFCVYVRNLTSEIAVIDVYLLGKASMETLPNKIKVANKVVAFKSGFRKDFNNKQNVIWIDTTHFKFILYPNTTVDFTDIAGRFVNGYPRGNVSVIISTETKVDTLMNGREEFKQDKFQYKHLWVSLSLLYYDIQKNRVII